MWLGGKAPGKPFSFTVCVFGNLSVCLCVCLLDVIFCFFPIGCGTVCLIQCDVTRFVNLVSESSGCR
jgi:hypothetical protein